MGKLIYSHTVPKQPHFRNASKTEPAKLLAAFVVDNEDKALTTPEAGGSR